MWGNTQTFTVPNAGGFFLPSTQNGGQLIKTSYGRPETWQWVFAAKLLQGPTLGDVPENGQVSVAFNLTIGIGRSNLIIPNFERFSWSWGAFSAPPLSVVNFSSSVYGNRAFPGSVVTDPLEGRVVNQIVSQDIQLEAIVSNQSTNVIDSTPVVVEVTAMFSPQHHFRPEWFLDRFPGGEHGGS